MKTAEQMLKSILNFSESESGELSRKVERARQQVKREFTTGPVVPAVGIEESIAAQVLADEQKIPFGRALAQVKGANLEQ